MKSTPLCVLICVGAMFGLTACGGGGGSGGGGAPASGGWTAGVFSPASTFEAQCVNPRSGTDPLTGRPFPDKPRNGSHGEQLVALVEQ